MIKNKFYGTCPNTGRRQYRQNPVKRIVVWIVACMAFSMNAQVSGEQAHQTSGSVVESIKGRLPIETPSSGTIVSVETPAAPLTVTADLGNVAEQNMRFYAQSPGLFKDAIMADFRAMGDPLVPLADAAFNAGIPFALHVTSTTFPEGFTVTFTIDDLKKGLYIEPSDK